jgi:MFS family permease
MLGGVVIVSGIAGSLGPGLLTDRGVRAGGSASRLRVAIALMVAGVACTLLAAAPGPPVVFALAGGWMLASTAGQSLGITVIQEVAPGDARGLAMSIGSLVNIGVGLALGAALPALILDHVLKDPKAVGEAVTLVALPCAILATGLYVLAYARLRRAAV